MQRQNRLPAVVVGNQHESDVVLTVRNYYRRKPQALRDAEASGVPVHVLRSNSASSCTAPATTTATHAPAPPHGRQH